MKIAIHKDCLIAKSFQKASYWTLKFHADIQLCIRLYHFSHPIIVTLYPNIIVLLHRVSSQVASIILQIFNHLRMREGALCVHASDCYSASCCMHTLLIHWKQGVICSVFNIIYYRHCVHLLKLLWSKNSGGINFADHLCLLCFLI